MIVLNIRNAVYLFVVLCFFVISGQIAYAENLTIERVFSDPDLNGKLPKQVNFSPDGTRVTYLQGRTTDFNQQDLWEYSIKEDSNRLLINSSLLLPVEKTLDDVEIARRERMRTSARGIVEYSWADNGTALVFSLGGDIYIYDFITASSKTLRQITKTPVFETDPKLSPKANYVSFIRDQDIFVVELTTGKEWQLTDDGAGTVKNGMAEFVAMEEMERDTGYWWSPDESQIVFTQIDETPVEIAQRYLIYPDAFKVTDERYPRAGTKNVLIKLGVVRLNDKLVRWIDLGQENDIYIPRVKWLPDSQGVVFQRLSRDQKTLELLLADPDTGKTSTILQEKSDTWINLHNDIYLFKHTPRFIWSSERNGFKHLYLYNLDGTLLRQLTSGKWVVNSLLHVDEKTATVYFDGFADTPLEKHLYRTGLEDRDESIRRITKQQGWHDIEFPKSGGSYLDRFSDPGNPPNMSVHSIDGSITGYVIRNALDKNHPYFPYLGSHTQPEYNTITAVDGQTLYYSLHKPRNFDPDKQYPVIIEVYGGPGVQRVSRHWDVSRNRYLWHQFLTRHGYLVFMLDNRGGPHRGKAFEDPIYHQFSFTELEDQKQGALHLKNLPFVDNKRIGLYGWSYGGYMSLMSIFREPEIFKVVVSGAPVIDWRLYDTFYTERYMGLPQINRQGYRLSNVLTYANDLKGQLMVIHGMADDNVLFQNSTLLISKLQKQDFPFEVMFYPGQTHRFFDQKITSHLHKTIVRFFDKNL